VLWWQGGIFAPRYSLEANGEGVSEQPSEELWHSLDLDESVMVHVEVVPGLWEVLLKVSSLGVTGEFHVGSDNLVRDSLGSIPIEEHMAGWVTVLVLHLEGVSLDEGVHESVVSLLGVLRWDDSLIRAGIRVGSVEVWNEMLELLVLELEVSPVVVQVAAESAIWVGISWHWTSDVWLGVLASLGIGPVVVQVRGEGAVWVSVTWHWASDVGLWVLTGLGIGPVVVEVARESAVWVSISWHWSSDIWLWVLINLSVSPVIVEVAGESAVRMSVSWHWSSNVWLRVLKVLELHGLGSSKQGSNDSGFH